MIDTPMETRLEEGMYCRRIARPYNTDPRKSLGWNPEDEEKSSRHDKSQIVAENAGQLHHLKEHLEQIARVIYPCKKNEDAFGHEIRNVFIVACTEVEAQWRGVLKANGFEFRRNKSTGEEVADRSEYKALVEPLRLDQYRVRFPYFPSFKELSPFRDWKSTGTLDWYDAYNGVKHDREQNFGQGTLVNALTAAAAYFIMLCAQHGREIAAKPEEARTKFFCLAEWPDWEEDYCYKPKTEGGERVFHTCKTLFAKDKSKAVEERFLVLATEQKLDTAITNP
jgi:hypothetical protein